MQNKKKLFPLYSWDSLVVVCNYQLGSNQGSYCLFFEKQVFIHKGLNRVASV